MGGARQRRPGSRMRSRAACRRGTVGGHGNLWRCFRKDGLVLLPMGHRPRGSACLRYHDRAEMTLSGQERSGTVSMLTRNVLNADRRVAHPAINTSRPNIARVYNYLLGGKDNFAADRNEAERLLRIYPLLPARAQENRRFLARAVTWMAEQGIRQFVDIGSGLPTTQNTHQMAQAVDPACRAAYVDYDPVVVAHARALLSANEVTAVQCDLRDPAGIVGHPDMGGLIRLGEPLGVILGMVLHFFDAHLVSEIMRTIVSSIAPGSYLVISVVSGDKQTGERRART